MKNQGGIEGAVFGRVCHYMSNSVNPKPKKLKIVVYPGFKKKGSEYGLIFCSVVRTP